MNKKKLNIILILGAIAIWVFIIIKIFTYSKNPAKGDFKTPVRLFSTDSTSMADTFIIYANYRDPFTPSGLKMVSISNTVKSQITPVQNKAGSNISWPDIVYGGFIKKIKDGRELALVTISDQAIVTEKNKETGGIRILSIYPDSVKVIFQKGIKTIVKK